MQLTTLSQTSPISHQFEVFGISPFRKSDMTFKLNRSNLTGFVRLSISVLNRELQTTFE